MHETDICFKVAIKVSSLKMIHIFCSFLIISTGIRWGLGASNASSIIAGAVIRRMLTKGATPNGWTPSSSFLNSRQRTRTAFTKKKFKGTLRKISASGRTCATVCSMERKRLLIISKLHTLQAKLIAIFRNRESFSRTASRMSCWRMQQRS